MSDPMSIDEAERRRNEVISGAVDTVAMADALAEVRAARRRSI